MSDGNLVRRRWFSVRSLTARMTLVFASLAAAIWFALAIWVVTDALNRGEANLTSEMRDYAHQVMAVAERWPADDPGIAGALEAVVNIENQANQDNVDKAEADQDASPDFLIQIWRDGRPVLPPQNGLEVLPNAFEELISVHVDNAERKLYAVQAASKPVVVALLVKSPFSASITWPSVAIVLLPLVISLPVLLIPAWLMTRFGLKPLRATTDEVLARVTEGKLTPLELTRYRELNPLLEAMNQLMARLSQQLKRERAFVADVAHELKTPLAALQTNIGTAVVTNDEARRQAALSDLDPGLKRTTHLVQQLLDMARLEVDEFQDRKRQFDLAEFCRERLSDLVRLADCRDIQLKADIPERLMVLTDPDPISSIVTNLVDNAIKYSPAGAVVLVSLAPEKLGGFVLTVTDQGDGIAMQDRAHVFERFYRCTASALKTEGAGLGMAIVKRAVTLLGGRITLTDGDLGGDAGRRGLKVSVRVPA
ncbi:MAG: sensor histidine kinase [Burkholderiaceae bacterium]